VDIRREAFSIRASTRDITASNESGLLLGPLTSSAAGISGSGRAGEGGSTANPAVAVVMAGSGRNRAVAGAGTADSGWRQSETTGIRGTLAMRRFVRIPAAT
jgi:hypothetical protein